MWACSTLLRVKSKMSATTTNNTNSSNGRDGNTAGSILSPGSGFGFGNDSPESSRLHRWLLLTDPAICDVGAVGEPAGEAADAAKPAGLIQAIALSVLVAKIRSLAFGLGELLARQLSGWEALVCCRAACCWRCSGGLVGAALSAAPAALWPCRCIGCARLLPLLVVDPELTPARHGAGCGCGCGCGCCDPLNSSGPCCGRGLDGLLRGSRFTPARLSVLGRLLASVSGWLAIGTSLSLILRSAEFKNSREFEKMSVRHAKRLCDGAAGCLAGCVEMGAVWVG
jgi:hypothetical protein